MSDPQKAFETAGTYWIYERNNDNSAYLYPMVQAAYQDFCLGWAMGRYDLIAKPQSGEMVEKVAKDICFEPVWGDSRDFDLPIRRSKAAIKAIVEGL